MNKYIEMPAERRELLCNQAQAALGLPAASIEKDFWVTFILELLFTNSKFYSGHCSGCAVH